MNSSFTVVDAAPQHFEWILELAVAASTSTFNGLRDTPAECVQALRNAFPDFRKWVEKGQYRFLVAVDDATSEPLGYLMLNLYDTDDLEQRQTFVQDAATHPKSAGRGVQHALYAAAIRITAEEGVDFMAMEFSASNPYFETALRNGCVLESYRTVRPCTPKAYERLQAAEAHRSALNVVKSKLSSLKERREKSRARRASPQ